MKKQLLFILIVLLVSCSGQKKEQRFKTLDIGVMASMDYLPLAVAKKNGYFEDVGIIVNLHKFYAANDRDAAIQSKSLDGSILDYTGAAIQHAGGIELYITSQCDGTFELIAGKNIQVYSPEELASKNYAVSRNTVVDYCTDRILESKGINPESIMRSEINKIPLRLEMINNGKIDMTVLPDPFASIARAAGNQHVASLQEFGQRVTGLVFTERALYRKIETIQAFYSAYNRAIRDLQEKPVTEFKDILIHEIGFPEELVQNVQLPAYNRAALPSGDDLEAVGSWLKSKELIPQDFDIFNIVYSKNLYK